MGKCGCKIVVKNNNGLLDTGKTFSMSGPGLKKAVAEVKKQGREYWKLTPEQRKTYPPYEAEISISCIDGMMEIATCDDRSCDLFDQDYGRPNKGIASGAIDKPKKVRKPRRKIPKSQQSPAQRRFAEAAADCKGTPGKGGYRTCMARTLGKK